ncbi:MAG: RNA-binding protein [Bacteroidales bacterium]|nr:RNA-binding protein [Bacteroidales bacterium]
MDIYVANLLYQIDEEYLEETFSFFGKVERVTFLRDKHTGDSRGKAFVRMPSSDEAKDAIEMLNGQNLKGRNILVQEAVSTEGGGGPRAFNPAFNGGGAPMGHGAPAPQSGGNDNEIRIMIRKLIDENNALKKELDELKETHMSQDSHGIVFESETFLPVSLLNLKPALQTFLKNNEVIYISKDSLLQRTNLKGFPNLGVKKVSEIRLALSGYFFNNGLKDPSEETTAITGEEEEGFDDMMMNEEEEF